MTFDNHWTGAPVYKSRRSTRLDGRYRRVRPTEREVEVYLESHPGQKSPAVHRLECLTCGQYIWGSGLGIGSHERGKEHTDAWLARREEVR